MPAATALRHAVEPGRIVLREGEPPGFPDLLQAVRAIRAGAREDHPNGAIPAVPCQGGQECIDRHGRQVGVLAGAEVQDSLGNDQVAVGRDHVDVVRLDRRGLLGLADGHGTHLGEDFAKGTLVFRVEVRNDHKGQAAIGAHRLQELRERLQPTGRVRQCRPRENAVRKLPGLGIREVENRISSSQP